MQSIQVTDFDLFIFDCDGVLWELDSPIEGSIETLNKLSDLNKRIYFYTNNTTKSRKTYLQKLINFGFSRVTIDQIITSAYVTANFIKDQYPEIKKIFVIGSEGLMEELQNQDFELLNGNFLNDFEFKTQNDFYLIQPDYSYQAVVVGFDNKINYAKSIYASLLVQNGAKFFVTNLDSSLKVGNQKQPGSSATSAQIIYGLKHIIEPTVLGKPNKIAVDQLLQQFKDLDKQRILVIGDTMETDIKLAKNAGIKSLLVETGIHKRSDLFKYPDYQPDFVLEKLSDIFTNF